MLGPYDGEDLIIIKSIFTLVLHTISVWLFKMFQSDWSLAIKQSCRDAIVTSGVLGNIGRPVDEFMPLIIDSHRADDLV